MANYGSERRIFGRTRAFIAAGSIALLLSCSISPCLARRAASFSLPTYSKMTDGAGPQTNDVSLQPAKKQSVSPITLDSENPQSNDDSSGGPKLKSTVQVSRFAPKGPIDPSSGSIFKTQDLGKQLRKQADLVSLTPPALIESEQEMQEKANTILEAETKQLGALWESTLANSKDVQFVIQKLMPSDDKGHAGGVLMGLVQTAIFGGIGAAGMAAGSSFGMQSGIASGQQMLFSLMRNRNAKAQRNIQLSQTEAILLYNNIRNVADKLVVNYRNYKRDVSALVKASSDLQDLQQMVQETRSRQDSASQIQAEYWLRKAQRDADFMADDAKRDRQQLVDLAGGEAVGKLDKDIGVEQMQVQQASPSGTPAAPQPTQQTAGNPQNQS